MTTVEESKARHPSNYGRTVGREAGAGPPPAPPGRHLKLAPYIPETAPPASEG